MTPELPPVTTNKLIGAEPSIQAEADGKSTVTQHAEIGGKRVKITLYFEHTLNVEQAKQAMNASLAKVSELAEAYQLGRPNEQNETTSSLTLHKDSRLTRTFTTQSEGPAEAAKSHTVTHNPQEVSAFLAKVKSTATQALANPRTGAPERRDDDAVSLHEAEGEIEDLVDDDLSVEGLEISTETPPVPPLKTSLPALSAKETTTGKDGKEFQDVFKLGDETIATEKVVRAETIKTLITGLETKIAKLEAKLAQLKVLPDNVADRQNLEKHIKKAKDDLKKCDKSILKDATWGSTNSSRFAFMHLGRSKAKESYAPVLCNLRMQTVADANGKVVSAVTRSAAISDFSHGEVSLQELKDLEEIQILSKITFKDLTQEQIPRITYLEKLYCSEGKSLQTVALEIKTKALVGYGIEKLASDPVSPKLQAVLTKLESSKYISGAMEVLSEAEKMQLIIAQIDDIKLTEVIDQRSDNLKQMALQDLQLHLKTRPHSGEGPILYGRTSLVDLRKAPSNEKGCILHERTQGLDMKAVFETLEGAEIAFDGEEGGAAYIDEKGVIHMPKDCAAEGVEAATLKPVFFNICVQGSSGHTVNEGMQKAINDEMLEKLRPQYKENQDFKDLEKTLTLLSENPNFDPNDAVLAVTQFLQKNNGYSGLNCYGGKDRTGYALALITHSHIIKLAKKAFYSPEAKTWGHQLLDKKGVAAKVAQDNADHTVLKLTRFDLLLFDTTTAKGKMLRACQLASGAFMGIKKLLKGTVGASQLAVSDTPGQLYRPAQPLSTKTKIVESFKQWNASRSDKAKAAEELVFGEDFEIDDLQSLRSSRSNSISGSSTTDNDSFIDENFIGQHGEDASLLGDDD